MIDDIVSNDNKLKEVSELDEDLLDWDICVDVECVHERIKFGPPKLRYAGRIYPIPCSDY